MSQQLDGQICTQIDLARLAGVSQRTVHRALIDHPEISARTRQRIMGLALKHGYRPNAQARAMRNRRTMQIGVLLPNNPNNRYQNPQTFEELLGVNEGLQAVGYALVMARIDEVFQGTMDGKCRLFDEHLVDGMIAISSMPHQVIEGLERRVPHTIWMDTNVWRDRCCIRRDEMQAGELAGLAVASAGYRRAIWVTYPSDRDERAPYRTSRHFSHDDRLAGFSRICQASGIPLRCIHPGDAISDAEAQIASILAPDMAVVADTTAFALWTASFANRLGKQPGLDFGLCCCDDTHEWDWTWPNLARATFDRYKLGLGAAEMLLAILENEKADCPSRTLPSTWHAGATLPGFRKTDL